MNVEGPRLPSAAETALAQLSHPSVSSAFRGVSGQVRLPRLGQTALLAMNTTYDSSSSAAFAADATPSGGGSAAVFSPFGTGGDDATWSHPRRRWCRLALRVRMATWRGALLGPQPVRLATSVSSNTLGNSINRGKADAKRRGKRGDGSDSSGSNSGGSGSDTDSDSDSSSDSDNNSDDDDNDAAADNNASALAALNGLSRNKTSKSGGIDGDADAEERSKLRRERRRRRHRRHRRTRGSGNGDGDGDGDHDGNDDANSGNDSDGDDADVGSGSKRRKSKRRGDKKDKKDKKDKQDKQQQQPKHGLEPSPTNPFAPLIVPNRPLRTRKHLLTPQDPIVKAAKRGDVARLKLIIDSYDPGYDVRCLINAPDQAGSHSILHTIWPGHVAALALLLLHGADPNKQNNRLNTALHFGCERGNKAIIHLLIRYGANAELENANKQLPWQTPYAEADQLAMRLFVERCLLERKGGYSVSTTALKLPNPRAQTPFRAEFYRARYVGYLIKIAKYKLNALCVCVFFFFFFLLVDFCCKFIFSNRIVGCLRYVCVFCRDRETAANAPLQTAIGALVTATEAAVLAETHRGALSGSDVGRDDIGDDGNTSGIMSVTTSTVNPAAATAAHGDDKSLVRLVTEHGSLRRPGTSAWVRPHGGGLTSRAGGSTSAKAPSTAAATTAAAAAESAAAALRALSLAPDCTFAAGDTAAKRDGQAKSRSSANAGGGAGANGAKADVDTYLPPHLAILKLYAGKSKPIDRSNNVPNLTAHRLITRPATAFAGSSAGLVSGATANATGLGGGNAAAAAASVAGATQGFSRLPPRSQHAALARARETESLDNSADPSANNAGAYAGAVTARARSALSHRRDSSTRNKTSATAALTSASGSVAANHAVPRAATARVSTANAIIAASNTSNGSHAGNGAMISGSIRPATSARLHNSVGAGAHGHDASSHSHSQSSLLFQQHSSITAQPSSWGVKARLHAADESRRRINGTNSNNNNTTTTGNANLGGSQRRRGKNATTGCHRSNAVDHFPSPSHGDSGDGAFGGSGDAGGSEASGSEFDSSDSDGNDANRNRADDGDGGHDGNGHPRSRGRSSGKSSGFVIDVPGAPVPRAVGRLDSHLGTHSSATPHANGPAYMHGNSSYNSYPTTKPKGGLTGLNAHVGGSSESLAAATPDAAASAAAPAAAGWDERPATFTPARLAPASAARALVTRRIAAAHVAALEATVGILRRTAALPSSNSSSSSSSGSGTSSARGDSVSGVSVGVNSDRGASEGLPIAGISLRSPLDMMTPRPNPSGALPDNAFTGGSNAGGVDGHGTGDAPTAGGRRSKTQSGATGSNTAASSSSSSSSSFNANVSADASSALAVQVARGLSQAAMWMRPWLSSNAVNASAVASGSGVAQPGSAGAVSAGKVGTVGVTMGEAGTGKETTAARVMHLLDLAGITANNNSNNNNNSENANVNANNRFMSSYAGAHGLSSAARDGARAAVAGNSGAGTSGASSSGAGVVVGSGIPVLPMDPSRWDSAHDASNNTSDPTQPGKNAEQQPQQQGVASVRGWRELRGRDGGHLDSSKYQNNTDKGLTTGTNAAAAGQGQSGRVAATVSANTSVVADARATLREIEIKQQHAALRRRAMLERGHTNMRRAERRDSEFLKKI